MNPPRPPWLHYLLYASTGAAGLLYQGAWGRLAQTVLGAQAWASASVTSGALAGLGLGAALGGIYFERRGVDPLKAFAWIQLAATAVAAPVPFLIRSVGSIPLDDPWQGMGIPWLRAFLVASVFLPPFVLLGAGFPLILKAVPPANQGRSSLLLYAADAAGAFAACLLAGYVLIPILGLGPTQALGLTLNAAAGFAALVLARAAGTNTPVAGLKTGMETTLLPEALWLFLVSISGFLAAACQVMVSRCFLLGTGVTPYALTLSLGIGLLSITGASLLAGILPPAWNQPRRIALTLLGMGGLLTLAWSFEGDQIPYLIQRMTGNPDSTWLWVQTSTWLVALAVAAPPMICFSSILPLGLRLGQSGVRRKAFLVAANAAAAGLGGLGAGLLLLPIAGLAAGLWLLGEMALGLALVGWSLVLARPGRWKAPAACLALAISFVPSLFRSPWDMRVLQAGPYTGPRVSNTGPQKFWTFGRTGRLLASADTATATLGVFQDGPYDLTLVVNGHSEATLADPDARTQKLLGHLPALVWRVSHPENSGRPLLRALAVGWGTGMTARALARHPFEVSVIDMNPETREISRFFEPFDPLPPDRTPRLIPGDARLVIGGMGPGQASVLTSDPFNPWAAGSGHLYTTEYFRSVRRVIGPEGVMGLFMPLYQLPPDEMIRLSATFASVFPQALLWFMGTDAVLTGGPLREDIFEEASWTRIWKTEVQADLASVGFDRPADLLEMGIRLDSKSLGEMLQGGLNTDSRPSLEFAAARALRSLTISENSRRIMTLISEKSAQAAFLKALLEAWALHRDGHLAEARFGYEAALLHRPDSSLAKRMYSEQLLQEARSAQARGDAASVLRDYQRSKSLGLKSPSRLSGWGLLLALANSCSDAEPLLQKALSVRPDDAPAWAALGHCAEMAGDSARSVESFRRAAQSEPWRWEHWRNLGYMSAKYQDSDGAAQAFQEAHRLNPSFSIPLVRPSRP